MSRALFRTSVQGLAVFSWPQNRNVVQNEDWLTQSSRRSCNPSDRRASMQAALIICQGINAEIVIFVISDGFAVG